ncbi:MAG: adenylate kinase [Streptococcaceae bacterium]|nr:adenylate kinase [Streptococcaceae bacterium]
MNLLIMGLPGAGKGTQAETIVRDYGVLHVSTGDMFRAAMANGTEMGKLAKSFIDKGELVPDEVTNGIVKDRLGEDDIRAHGVLLDGYPRTIEQAQALDAMLVDLGMKLDAVINIDVDPSVLVGRISGRFICKKCGATYNKPNKMPKVADTCDVCGSHEFFQRDDDKPETVANRIEINTKQSAPILAHYREAGLVHDVDGMHSIEETTREIKGILDAI